MPRLGILVPSSNTALEPLVAAMLNGLPDVTAHFSRFGVTRIDLSEGGLAQFDHARILAAAHLLADARVDAICWNGTSSGWLGFDADHELCAALVSATGIPAVTSVLALNEAMALVGARTFGLISPYTGDVQDRIMANYRAHGIACVVEHHLGISRNFDFATVPTETLERCVREAARSRPEVLTTFCTNLRAAGLVARLEKDLGLPIFDTIATGIWKALSVVHGRPERIQGWGSLFGLGASTHAP